MYCELDKSAGRKKWGQKKRLMHAWGIKDNSLLRKYYNRMVEVRGCTRKETTHKMIRLMDEEEAEANLICVIKAQKANASIRKIQRAFMRKAKGKVTVSQIYNKMVRLHAEAKRRRYTPLLTQSHCIQRLFFANEILRTHAARRWRFCFDLDEKIFKAVTTNGKVWILPNHMTDEEIRAKTKAPVTSKRYVDSVMYLTVVGRPDPALGGFNGKLFIHRVAKIVKQLRKSKKRKAGDLRIEATTIDAKEYLKVIRKLLQEISKRFAAYKDQIPAIYVQHDGASPHRAAGVEAKMAQLGCQCVPPVIFYRQNPRSPEQNGNDLAVYKSLGAKVEQTDYKNVEELCVAVEGAWNWLHPDLLDRVFAVKTVVFKEIARAQGRAISIPSTGIRQAQAAGLLWQFVDEYRTHPDIFQSSE